jgi:hypothetical protein
MSGYLLVNGLCTPISQWQLWLSIFYFRTSN